MFRTFIPHPINHTTDKSSLIIGGPDVYGNTAMDR